MQESGLIKLVASELNVPSDFNFEEVNLRYMLKQKHKDYEFDALINSFESLELLDAVQRMENENGMLILDNVVLQRYLEQNDPKLLIGFEANLKRVSVSRSSRSSSITSKSISISTKQSIVEVTDNRVLDYKLNSKTKNSIIERILNEYENQIRTIEKTTEKQTKNRHAKVKEFEFRIKESEELKANFELHFIEDNADLIFLETAPERQLQEKFMKFMIGWFRKARTLVGILRLTIDCLESACIRERGDMLLKRDLKAVVTEVDFEQLIIKRSQMQQDYDEKMTHMAGVKSISSKTLYHMNKEKASVQRLEENIKHIDGRSNDIKRNIYDLEKEVSIIVKDNAQVRKHIDKMIIKLEQYEAPSVQDYMGKKLKEAHLRRVQKNLNRKIDLAKMDLKNKKKKLINIGSL